MGPPATSTVLTTFDLRGLRVVLEIEDSLARGVRELGCGGGVVWRGRGGVGDCSSPESGEGAFCLLHAMPHVDEVVFKSLGFLEGPRMRRVGAQTSMLLVA